MKAEIIAIGDELLIGQTADTNSAWIARELAVIGIASERISVIPDREEAILEQFRRAFHRSDIVLITGGLGPTKDDLTKELLADFFDLPIVFRNDILKQVRDVYRQKELAFAETSRSQAEFPEGATPMTNDRGTAPGIWVERQGRIYAAMPGVPSEMRGMMMSFVLPRLKKMIEGEEVTLFRTLHTYGIIEARLSELLDNQKQIREQAALAFLPSYSGVRLRLTVENTLPLEGQRRLDRAEELVREKAEDYIYHVGEDGSLERGVAKLLQQKRWKLAVAESCTAGLLGKRLTDLPGSSAYFERGFLTYSNEAKHEMLGVPWELLEQHGAVSAEVAEAMAVGALRHSRAQVAVSITGIAGPDGGTEEKPVGLVYIGYADARSTTHLRRVFDKQRDVNRSRSAAAALMLLMDRLRGTSDEDQREMTLV